MRGERMAAPDLLDVEVLSVLRRQLRERRIDDARAEKAVEDLRVLPVRRLSHRSLTPRIWSLRHTVTAYGGAYVALAEALELTLVTADARLSRAPGVACPVEVFV